MANSIVCPECGRTITDNPLVEAAAQGEGDGSDFTVCECGRRISFWTASAQLAQQKKFSTRLSNWLHSLGKSRA